MSRMNVSFTNCSSMDKLMGLKAWSEYFGKLYSYWQKSLKMYAYRNKYSTHNFHHPKVRHKLSDSILSEVTDWNELNPEGLMFSVTVRNGKQKTAYCYSWLWSSHKARDLKTLSNISSWKKPCYFLDTETIPVIFEPYGNTVKLRNAPYAFSRQHLMKGEDVATRSVLFNPYQTQTRDADLANPGYRVPISVGGGTNRAPHIWLGPGANTAQLSNSKPSPG